MKCDKKSLLLYAVTDRTWLNDDTLYEQVEKAIKGGVTFVQLREKKLDEKSFIDEAFILRFTPCCKKQENIRLGKIVDGKFEPAHISPFDSWEGHKEVRYEHFEHSFIQEFMERIFEYKLANRKPNITMDDMYEILESYGFSRKNEITRLARVLKRAEEKATNDYKTSTSVADAYKK